LCASKKEIKEEKEEQQTKASNTGTSKRHIPYSLVGNIALSKLHCTITFAYNIHLVRI